MAALIGGIISRISLARLQSHVRDAALQSERVEVCGVGAVEEFGEGDVEGAAEFGEVAGEDGAAADFEVADGGAGPAEAGAEVFLEPFASASFGSDVGGDDVGELWHGVNGRSWCWSGWSTGA